MDPIIGRLIHAEPADDDAGGTDGGKPDETKAYTQAQLDQMFEGRVQRERAKFADYDDLKSKAAKLDELEQASKTELDKERDARAAAEKERDEARTAVKETTLRASVIAAAARKNIVDPDAAFALLDRSTITVDDAGKPTNVDEAIDALLKAKPYLAGGARGGTKPDLGARGGNGDGAGDMNNLIRQAAGRA